MVNSAGPDLHVDMLMLRWCREAEGEKPTSGQRSGEGLPAAPPPRLGSWRALLSEHQSLSKDAAEPTRLRFTDNSF